MAFMTTHSKKLFKTRLIIGSLCSLFAGTHLYAASDLPNYSIIYSSKETKNRAIYLSDENGKSRLKVIGHTDNDGYPEVSPDGRQITFYGKYDKNKTWSIHSANIDGTNARRLTNMKHVWDSSPSWSSDGKTIVFAREYDDPENGWQEEIWLMNADGTEQNKVPKLAGRAPQFLSDGRILFHSKSGPSQICIANKDGSELIKLTNNENNDWSPKVSPDGSQIVFISDRDGNREIYTMNIDGSAQTRITQNSIDDWDPAWTASGSHILFVSENTEGQLDIYKANKDGSDIKKVLSKGLQVSSVRKINKSAVQRLLQRKKLRES